MRKVLLPLAAIALLATSCSDKNAFTVSGTTDAQDSSYVYLKDVTFSKDQAILDSALVIGGKFELKGSALQPAFRVLTADGKAQNLVIQPGMISVDLIQGKVSGTAMNDSLQAYYEALQVAKDNSKQLQQGFRELIETKYKDVKEQPKEMPADIQEFYDKMEASSKAESGIVKDFVNANIDNVLGQYLFVYESRRFSTDEQKEAVAKLSDDLKKVSVVEKMVEYHAVLDKTAEGQTFTDLKAKDPEGKDIALSDFAGKGNVVLVDFWASWCPPCRADMPELVKMYKEYKGKGFEIVGVSLDKEQTAWVKGIKDLNITWPQISDLKFWDSELSKAYGVRGIPHTVLLDKDGKIVARGLRGEELAAKIAELMK